MYSTIKMRHETNNKRKKKMMILYKHLKLVTLPPRITPSNFHAINIKDRNKSNIWISYILNELIECGACKNVSITQFLQFSVCLCISSNSQPIVWFTRTIFSLDIERVCAQRHFNSLWNLISATSVQFFLFFFFFLLP